MSTIRVAAVQMEPRLGEAQRNLNALIDRIDEARRSGASLIVFPECALTGYCFESREEALALAEPITGPSVARLVSHCAEVSAYVVVGMIERDGEAMYNACVLVGPQGPIATYRKVHLPYLGLDRFVNPGDRPFAVHEAGPIRVGMHICYDGAFPEVGRVMTLLGADLLVLPTNWPTHAETAAEHLIPCRALENVVYAMAVNRVGEERTFKFIGRSSIAGPDGEVLAKASPDAEEILYAEIDPARARQKRLIRRPGLHEIDRIGDRRPRFYGPIVEPNGRD